MKTKLGHHSVWLILSLFLAGCALGDRRVMLSYPPESSEKGLEMLGVKKTVAPALIPILLVPFEDEREEGELIGEVLNGYGMRTADVVARNDVGHWVTDAIKSELEKAGYKVTVAQDPRKDSDQPLLSGKVGRIFCSAYTTYRGEVGFETRLELKGEEIFSKRYLGTAKSGLNWAMTARSYNRVLSLALQDAAARFVRDLNNVFVVEGGNP